MLVKTFTHLLITASLLAVFAFASTPVQAQTASNKTNKQLSDVKASIKEQKQALAKLNKDNKKLEQALKRDDLAIAKLSTESRHTSRQLKATQQKLTQLNQQQKQLTAQKQQQEKLLAQQLRTAYSTGQYDYLKLLLNQQDASKVERTMSYYQYLSKARIKQIESFEQTIAELLAITEAQQQQAEKLQALKQQQQNQQQKLASTRKARAKTIAQLNQQIASDQQKLNQLEAQEASLVAALKELERLAKQSLSLNGLAKLKGKLSWPVKGRRINRYGSRKQGYLTWKGTLFNAPVGRQVRAIHNGKVLFSDWLKGYGLVTVIDHGKGYMSLYAHNQTLLKKVGDRVETGEPIALVGQSGGREQTSLYFEIRHQGKAVNPRLWCR